MHIDSLTRHAVEQPPHQVLRHGLCSACHQGVSKMPAGQTQETGQHFDSLSCSRPGHRQKTSAGVNKDTRHICICIICTPCMLRGQMREAFTGQVLDGYSQSCDASRAKGWTHFWQGVVSRQTGHSALFSRLSAVMGSRVPLSCCSAWAAR